jgi:cytosine/adenosine deaminase-related metal-dependent hydrolase
MPDTPVAPRDGGPYDPLMEARVSQLEEDMREVKAAWPRMEAAIIRIATTLAATLPHLATKADLADLKTELKADIARLDGDKPGKAYLWGILAVLLTAYACGLAGLAILK